MLDRATIFVRAGRGGDGCVSFRREKHVPKGGPDGGDGAPGGDVLLVASRQFHDLSHFRHRHHFSAADGGRGRGRNRRGADGAPLRIQVPVGTEVRERDAHLVADLILEGQEVTVARGGEGGRGNTVFKSSTRQAPRFAENGLPGEEKELVLTLKLLADVGLVGLPNTGKSSLLAALTRAKPRIAAYPFTTIEPNLGVLRLDERDAVLADIPGLIEGASRGAGLGHRFLAHVERTALLVYVLDGGEGPGGWREALHTVRAELRAFRAELLERPAIVAVNKADLLDEEARRTVHGFLAAQTWAAAALLVSAESGEGTDALATALREMLQHAWAAEAETAAAARSAHVVLRPGQDRLEAFTVEAEAGHYVVRGAQVERLFAKADLDNEDAVAYLQTVIERAGLNEALRRAGAKPGDTVLVGDREFEFS